MRIPLSKEQLIENDKFALLETFKRASIRCKDLYQTYTGNDGDIPLYDLLISDLQNMTITDTLLIWQKKFATDMKLIIRLVE